MRPLLLESHEMRVFKTLTIALTLPILGATELALTARADFIIRAVGVLSRTSIRIRNDGTFVRSYRPHPDFDGVPYEISSHVLSGDGETLYQLQNDIVSSLFAYDVKTGARLNGDYGVPLQFQSPGRFPAYSEAAMFSSDSIITAVSDGGSSRLIATVDIASGNVQNLGTIQHSYINDIAYADPLLVVADESQVSVFLAFSTLLVPFSTIDATGNVALADGEVFIRDASSGDVKRYSTSGQFLGTFIAAQSLVGELGSIQFGPDGDLYAYQTITKPDFSLQQSILRFDGNTGALVTSTPLGNGFFGYGGRILILPVPEPGSASLVFAAIAAIAVASRSPRISACPAPASHSAACCS